MTRTNGRRLPAVLVVAAAASLLLSCDPAKPVFKYAWYLGGNQGRDRIDLMAGQTKSYEIVVTDDMLQWGDKQVTICMDLNEAYGQSGADFFIFDHANYILFQLSQEAVALQKCENSTRCDMWWSVSSAGSYYAVVSTRRCITTHGFDGLIWATYWDL